MAFIFITCWVELNVYNIEWDFYILVGDKIKAGALVIITNCDKSGETKLGKLG